MNYDKDLFDMLIDELDLITSNFEEYRDKYLSNVSDLYVSGSAENAAKNIKYEETQNNRERYVQIKADDFTINVGTDGNRFISQTIFNFKIERRLLIEVNALISYLNINERSRSFDYEYNLRQIHCFRKSEITLEACDAEFNDATLLIDLLSDAVYYKKLFVDTISKIDQSALLMPGDEGYDDDVSGRKSLNFAICFPNEY